MKHTHCTVTYVTFYVCSEVVSVSQRNDNRQINIQLKINNEQLKQGVLYQRVS